MQTRLALLLFFLAVHLSLGAETRRLLKPEDFAAIRDVDEPNLSPDGQSVVYVVGTNDLKKDKQPKNLWLAKWDSAENRPLTFGENEQTHPRWSPDGKWIAFLSSRMDENENEQLWILSSAGGEAEQLTKEKGSVEDFAWSPDSKRIVLVLHDPDPREPEAKEKEKKTVPPIVIDRFQFKKDIDGYITNRWSHLKLLDLASRKLADLTSGQHDDVLPAWSPDGQQIAFVTNRDKDPDRTENWDIYLIDAKAGAKERQLTTTPEADCHPDWESPPAWSPDGKTIAFIHGGDPKKIEYATHSLAIIPVAGGAAKVLTPNLDRNVIRPRWSPDGKSILALVEDDGAQTLVRIPFVAGVGDPGSTESRPTENVSSPTPVVGGRRTINAFDVNKEGKSRCACEHTGATL